MDIIETKRLVLRRQTVKDDEFILDLMNDPEWIRYIGDRGVRTLDEARTYIEEAAAATVEYSRDVVKLNRIVAIVTPSNTNSVRLLEKLGFSFEQTIDDSNGDKVHLLALAL